MLPKTQQEGKSAMFSEILQKTNSKEALKTIKTKLQPCIESVHLLIKKHNPLKDQNYDLPLNKGSDANFLILLISLMSFLAVLSLSGTIAISKMTNRWSSGLENKITIEIAVETKDGHILSQETIGQETLSLYKMLSKHKDVKSANVLSDEDIQELLSPWLGQEMSLKDIPLPGLIAVELRNIDEKELKALSEEINKTSNYAKLETHREWLSDLINFANALKTLAFVVTIIVAFITVVAISYAVRTRLALHHNEVKLLHHMGASDNYIAKQFRNHSIILSFKGGIIGTACGLVVTFVLTLLSRNTGTDLIPVIHIGAWGIFLLSIVPIIVCMIAVITSYLTVLRSLAKMP
jgi:cell division transport system permease protein